ncbi:unannotated protein [freshwater metagenome]|uniref:Unannotated protein n=1 Tax=freshwater metagenome TaxID=449393 RepID=A0A6J7JRJ3_9ZZZZ
MSPDRNVASANIFKHRFGSTDVMKVRVENSDNWPTGDLAQFHNGLAHFFGRLARIDCDNSVGALNKGLVGKSVTDKAPHSTGDFIKATGNDFRLSDVITVGDLPTRKGHGFG